MDNPLYVPSYLLLNSIPAIFLIALFLLRERKKEPLSIVLSAFALTYIIIIPLDILIYIIDPILEDYFLNENYPFKDDQKFLQHFYAFDAFFRAAFLEEFLKFSVFFLFIYKNTHFDELSDGVIYGLTIGLGYAVVENYGYLSQFYIFQEEMKYFVMNRWWALLGHVSLGIIMGMFIAKSRILNHSKYILLIASLCVPIFLHGLHNYSFSSDVLENQNVSFHIFILDIVIILLSFIFLPKLETYKFKFDNKNITADYLKVSIIGLTFSLIISLIFGLIN